MIGSPWNPFLTQAIPGTATRYDGRRVDSSDVDQYGAFDLVSLPQFLEVVAEVPEADADPVVMRRDYQLFGTGSKLSAETLSAAFGDQWATQASSDILATAFFWWWKNQETFNGGLPRVLYRQDVDGAGARWWLAAGLSPGSAALPEGYVVPDWNVVWMLWHADDAVAELGGTPTKTHRVDGITTGNNSTWPIYVSGEAEFDDDIPAGSRWISAIDLNRPVLLQGISSDLGTQEIRPWYRGAR